MISVMNLFLAEKNIELRKFFKEDSPSKKRWLRVSRGIDGWE